MNASIPACRTLLIFDLDGTLYRTETSFLETVRRVFREHGIAPPGGSEIMANVGDTFADFLAWMKPHGFAIPSEVLGQRIAEIEFEAIRESGQAYPGVRETLRTLKARGYMLAICTNGDAPYAEAVLRRIGVHDQFDAIRTFEDESLPKPAMVAELQTAFHPLRTVMIGDRSHDIEAGRANGCAVIGAAYGFGAPEEIESADVVLRSITDLPHHLERLERGAPLGDPPPVGS